MKRITDPLSFWLGVLMLAAGLHRGYLALADGHSFGTFALAIALIALGGWSVRRGLRPPQR